MNNFKKNARGKIKEHYWHSLIVSFIVLLIIGGGYKYNSFISNKFVTLGSDILRKNNLFIFKDIFDTGSKVIETTRNYHPTKGILSVFFNQINGTGSLILGIVNAIMQFISFRSIPTLIIKMFGIILFIFIFIFIQNIIIVGKNRYYIEHHNYKNVKVDKIFFVYRVKKTLNVAYVMFFKEFYLFLWMLTIVGGIIKYYSYIMIPYVLAENPELTKNEAFYISDKMVEGHRYEIFKIQLSFIPWILLSYLTFNMSNIFYFNIYKEYIYSEIYFSNRNRLLKIDDNYEYYFKDKLLNCKLVNASYPNQKYFISESNVRKWLKFDYHINYSLNSIILFFFTCSMIGWLWEVLLNFFVGGFFANKGTMYGPWLPIYGYGALAIIILLKNFRDKPWRLFLSSITLCGIIEYFTAWYLETFNHMRWWDYDGFFLNFKGRICLEGLLVFGLAGVVFTYVLAPLLNNVLCKIDNKKQKIIILILVLFYLIDFIYSCIIPNTGNGITFINNNIINLI